MIMFGYATLADIEYISALLGAHPLRFPAVLYGYELRLQSFETMPPLVKKVSSINWKPSEFKSYFAFRNNNPKSKIDGVAWSLTIGQIAILDDWEFVGLWYHKIPVQIVDKKGKKYNAITYSLNAPGKRVSQLWVSLHKYPVNKKKMLTLAKKNNLAARRARGER